MRTLVFIIVALLACVAPAAHATAYRKSGMTNAVVSNPVKNPNKARYEAGLTMGAWACQDTFSLAAGDVYTFVPWTRVGGALKSFTAWAYQVLPASGAVRVTAYPTGHALTDTICTVVSPDSTFQSINDVLMIDSLRVRCLVKSRGVARAR